LRFRYIESLTKLGEDIIFSESEFKRLLNQKMFKRLC
jgi:hypothetical protein